MHGSLCCGFPVALLEWATDLLLTPGTAANLQHVRRRDGRFVGQWLGMWDVGQWPGTGGPWRRLLSVPSAFNRRGFIPEPDGAGMLDRA